ncbi:MAG TPA: WGxxGxxG family protein [Candidatus Obscuribacterales bacterium]
MKPSNLSKIAGASLLALSLSILPSAIPASAQTNSNDNSTTVDTTPFQETKNDGDHNFGWLGLLGLIGLANLFRKDSRHEEHSEREVVTGPGSGTR